jgi:hypothetical protein
VLCCTVLCCIVLGERRHDAETQRLEAMSPAISSLIRGVRKSNTQLFVFPFYTLLLKIALYVMSVPPTSYLLPPTS